MEARAGSPLPSNADREREALVISEHLPAGYSAEFDGGANDNITSAPAGPTSDAAGSLESSLKLQGGDMHRDLFRAAARTRMHKRAATFHSPRLQATGDGDGDDDGLTIADHMVPGGFRRAFIQQNRNDHIWASRIPVTRNFVEFLDLYGSFAGEDLADSDDEAIETDDEDDDEDDGQQPHPSRASENRPLLGRRKSTRAPRTSTASTTKTFFTLLKAFIGTGIMFLPKAFNNGGILFSSLTMLTVAVVTMLAFHLLLACKAKYGGGYGDIGQAIAGPRMRSLILASVTLSQLGFVCAGIVFVAENMTSFFKAVYHSSESPFSATTLVLAQLVVLFPLAFIRNIAKLGAAALLADVCILLGVSYIYYYDIAHIATHGIHKTVVLFNPDKYFLTIGSAIFTFEGIGLILPIQSSMAKPQRFEPLLGLIMIIITVLYTSVGALCYATFGSNTSIEIIDNYPQSSAFVNAVQFLYSVAVLVGTPVQLFPALRIIEGKIFASHKSGRKSARTKWTKNAFRTFLVGVCGVVSILGAGNLDRFVALIGSFACVPLVYIYPAYLHYKGVAETRAARWGDVVFMVVGLVCMVFTTVITVVNSFF